MSLGRFLKWPHWDEASDRQFQRYGCSGLFIPLLGIFVAMPAALLFLTMAWSVGGWHYWFVGLTSLLVGLVGIGLAIRGCRAKPGRLYREKPRNSPLEYLEQVFRKASTFETMDRSFVRVIEQGLQSADGAHWVEVCEALKDCTGHWAPYLEARAAQDPEALCWLTAAAHGEEWSSGANRAQWLRAWLREQPDSEARLAALQASQDPWIVTVATWAMRVLQGQDKWVGKGSA